MSGNAPGTPPTTLPPSLAEYPEVDCWLRFEPDETVTVFTGKVDLGQGITTALTAIAADELDLDVARIRVHTADTAAGPDEGLTAGSQSVEHSGCSLRLVCAQARASLFERAARWLACPSGDLDVDDGTVTARGRNAAVTYWELMSTRLFAIRVDPGVAPKRPEQRRVTGRPQRRVDLEAKVFGEPSFIQDLALPDLVHARVVRAARPGQRPTGGPVDGTVTAGEDARVVRREDFIAVVCASEPLAVSAARRVEATVTWVGGYPLPDPDDLFDRMPATASAAQAVVNGVATLGPAPAPTPANAGARLVRVQYRRPFQMHASLAPSAAAARFDDGALRVWSHSQGIGNLRVEIARTLGLAVEDIRITHVPSAGCYGHNGADDAALDAATIAQALPGRSILLKWTRGQEHLHEPYGPAMRIDIEASLDATGRIAGWSQDVFSGPHGGRPAPAAGPRLLAAREIAGGADLDPARDRAGPEAGGHRNASPIYRFARERVVKHPLPASTIRTSSLRSLGAYANVFAIESCMDELAAAGALDPLQLRLDHLDDERGREVLARLRAALAERPAAPGCGRGIAFARYKNRQTYAAVAIDARVDAASGVIDVVRAVIVADAGEIIDPDGLANQLEGGLVQALSWTLHEAVRFDTRSVHCVDWDTYRVLRFAEVPEIETHLIGRPDHPPLGAGEATQGPTAAALANAVFASAGIRLREIPFTPGRVAAALAELAPRPA